MTAAKQSDASSFQQPLLDQPRPVQTQTAQYVVVLPPYPPPHRHRLLRKSGRRCLFCFAIFLLFLVAAGYLLWPSDPDLSIARLRLDRVRFHTRPKISLDLTMDLTLRVRNRDFYSMDYNCLLVAIGYRGKRIGFVTSDGGQIERRGSSYINATLQLERVEILSDVILFIEDWEKGVIAFDTVSEITGKLGVIVLDLPLKTKKKCEMIVNTQNQKIVRQSCYPEATIVK